MMDSPDVEAGACEEPLRCEIVTFIRCPEPGLSLTLRSDNNAAPQKSVAVNSNETVPFSLFPKTKAHFCARLATRAPQVALTE
jgi:hypothetical protein